NGVAESLSMDLSAYLLAAATGAKSAALDTETIERFRKYLAAPEKSHPFLAELDRLRSSGAGAESLRPVAERFQALVNSVLEQKKSIDEYNEHVLEESKKSKDPYDIYCKGCN